MQGILNSVLSKLSSLRLSLYQWTFLTLAVAFGALVAAFRAQGTALHKTQIQLLLATTRNSDSAKELAVKIAKDKLQAALADYYRSQGGK